MARRHVAVVRTAVRIPGVVAVVAARPAVDPLVVGPADCAVIERVVQQRAIVARTLFAGVTQRLIALRPLLVRARPEVSDHARGNDQPRRMFPECEARHSRWRFSVRLMLCRPACVEYCAMGNKQKISTPDGGRKSGRAVFDNQGRASWEWQTATGVFETNVTHEQLQTLEAAGLSVVEEPVTDGRVWTAPTRPAAPLARRAAPARDQTVLKRLLRRIAG